MTSNALEESLALGTSVLREAGLLLLTHPRRTSQETLDTSTPTGKAMFTIVGAMASREPFADYRRYRQLVSVARNQLATICLYCKSPRGETMRVIYLVLVTALALLALLLAAVAALRA